MSLSGWLQDLVPEQFELAYSRIIENAAIDLNLQARFKNTVTGPGYNRILNVAQNGSIAAFFTKRNYKSQPIGGGKM